jgi:HK97 family phage portal protein
MRNPFRRTQPNQLEQRALMAWWAADLEPYQNVSGERVSSTSVLGLSAAWSAVGTISDSIATLPVDAVLEEGDTRIPSPDKPIWLDEPGNDLTSIDVRGQILVSLLLRGEAFILTPRTDNGEVQGLVVLDPDKMTQDPETKNWSAVGQDLGPGELVIIRGLMLPGSTRGCSPVTYAREVFGGALATQKFGNAFFGNGAWTGAIIEVPGPLSEDGQKAIKAYVNENHKGAANAHKVGVLVDDAKLSRPLTFSPEDSQFLQSKDHNVGDIARMFWLDPSMIGGTTGDSLTYSTLEGRGTHFVKFSLLRWIVRYEDAMTRLWKSEGGPENGKVKLNVNGLLRGSTKERADVYALALDPDKGWMTVNEVRALEDMAPIEEQPRPKVGF